MVVTNTRTLAAKLTGVQRYASEIVNRLDSKVECIAPAATLDGIAGHAWEQLVLPTKLRGRLLWSPSNTGPLLVQRQVVTVHDVVPLDHPEWLNPRFAAWYRFLLPKLIPRVRRVITVSDFSKTRILEHVKVDPSRVVVIPNGVDSRFYPRTEKEHADLRGHLELPSPYYILSLGSLEPRKNLERLLKAWAMIYEELPQDVWLVVAGARGKAQIFRDVNFEVLPPRVHFSGHVPDQYLPALYSSALGFAYVSYYEGFGIPPLEAMASGTPVLTGNRTALTEVVADAGLTVNPLDVEAIADNLVRLVNDETLRETLRERGLLRAKKFNWDDIAARTWQVLLDAASE